MSIRIVSNEQVRFDVDVESYNRIVRDITLHVTARCEEQINQMIANGISSELSQSISESIDLNNVAMYVSANLNYSRVIEIAKQQLVANLLADDRFNVLVTRGINSATVGFIDEAVERVTAQLGGQLGIESDV
jgi:ribosomal protein S4E